MRLAVFTSLNPVRSGISDYAEALLPHLAKHFEIDVFIDDYKPQGFEGGEAITIRNWRQYRPQDVDATLYHVGNNPYHIYMYDTVLKHPGIVVLHEFNLHHLIADLTIKRGDWEGYLQEAEYNGGSEALARARRVQAQEAPPDFEGLPMNRRILESAHSLIVHSNHLVNRARDAGFRGPVRRIPHGVRIPEVNRNAWRAKLGLDETTPLIGAFGFLRPHKRIGEGLLAMKRLIRVEPRARMILVGEEHPHFPVRKLISHLELEPFVRVMGYVPLEDLEGWISAVDICLNLRYPSVGETSGTLARALGLGRAVVVSDVGSFSELPDDICLKVPVGESEEDLPIGHRPLRIEEVNNYVFSRKEVDLLTEYLTLLVTRPRIADAMGQRARTYVAQEWNWAHVGDLYADWIRAVTNGRAEAVPDVPERASRQASAAAAVDGHGSRPLPPPHATDGANSLEEAAEVLVAVESGAKQSADSDGSASLAAGVEPRPSTQAGLRPRADPAPSEPRRRDELAEYILGFCHDRPDDASYVRKHITRLVHTLEIIPRGSPRDRILEMGAYLHITPALKSKLSYGEVRGSYLGPLGKTDFRRVRSASGEVFECEVDLFNAERDPFPYEDESLSTVICCELLEHLCNDPMHMMAEINRILKPGGHVVLSTPNICSVRAVQAILLGYHPGLFHQYLVPSKNGEADPRHSREYAPRDVQELLEAAGFSVSRLETGPYVARRSVEHEWISHLLRRYKLPDHLRDDVIHAVGKKAGTVKERYPAFLYTRGDR